MLESLKSALAFGMVTILAGTSMAQSPAGMSMGVPVGLLGNPSVQQELKLDESQIQKSKVLIEETRQKALGNSKQLANIPVEERRTKQKELQISMNVEAMKNAGAFLKPEQVNRFLQIEIQRRGYNAFLDPAISTKLGFTDAQIGQVNSLITEQANAFKAALKAAAEDKKAVAPTSNASRKETLEKILTVLTDDQKKTWKEMIGEPFEIGPPLLPPLPAR